MLQASYLGSSSPYAELDTRVCLDGLLPDHDVDHQFLEKPTAVGAVRATRADVFVNLCDGSWEEDTPGIEVVQALERLRRPFTGADSAFYDPTREMMKRICYYWGIDTPAFVFARDLAGIEEAVERIPFPCFVKPENGYSSIGLTERSRAHTPAELRAVAFEVIERFGGALIEEYIDGREFSVLVASDPTNPFEPRTYLPIEHQFEDGISFKTFDYKWKWPTPHIRLPVLDKDLASRLRAMSADVFQGLRGNGYARTDIRMDRDGRLYFLEINPNCGVFYSDDNGGTADDILRLDGVGKAGFLEQMIEFALARQKNAERAYVVRKHPGGGHAIYAARDLTAGERIYQLEERPHVLVSRSHVERTWSPRYREFFKHFAYPLTDEVFVLWDDDPDQWKPINHSCDPNAWVTGLDLHARRPIAAGEEITMDYATMYAEPLVTFECRCGANICRGGWRRGDFQEPWFRARYGDHVSDYVRQKQAR
ncbi:MAG: SET domain-containing protein-lysine N-methyltransferase [Chloroflexota bacterium]